LRLLDVEVSYKLRLLDVGVSYKKVTQRIAEAEGFVHKKRNTKGWVVIAE
jgi:molybdenum cofactor biosynthesis enzyme